MKYYELQYTPDGIRWYLDSIYNDPVDERWRYGQQEWVSTNFKEPLKISILQHGIPSDWVELIGSTPVVSTNAVLAFKPTEVQLISAIIDGYEGSLNYYVVVFRRIIDSAVLSMSKYTDRRNKFGHIIFFEKLVVDSAKIGTARVFRLASCPDMIIVNQEIAEYFLNHNIEGITFKEVEVI